MLDNRGNYGEAAKLTADGNSQVLNLQNASIYLSSRVSVNAVVQIKRLPIVPVFSATTKLRNQAGLVVFVYTMPLS